MIIISISCSYRAKYQAAAHRSNNNSKNLKLPRPASKLRREIMTWSLTITPPGKANQEAILTRKSRHHIPKYGYQGWNQRLRPNWPHCPAQCPPELRYRGRCRQRPFHRDQICREFFLLLLLLLPLSFTPPPPCVKGAPPQHPSTAKNSPMRNVVASFRMHY